VFKYNEITVPEIKLKIKQLVEMGFINDRVLTTEQKILGEELCNISLAIFSEIKEEVKTYTIDNSYVLKEFNGENFNHVLAAQEIFKNNSDAFHQLVSKKYVNARGKSSSKVENQIFYWKIYSQYAYATEELYCVYKNNQFLLFNGEMSKINIDDFIFDYFGELSEEQKERIEVLKQSDNLTHDQLQSMVGEFCKDVSEYFANLDNFQVGAITFFDFLGWKGLWMNKNSELFLKISCAAST